MRLFRALSSTRSSFAPRRFSTFPSNRMIIQPVPCFSDNYAYLLLDEKTQKAAVVDPAEPEPVLKALKDRFPEYTLSAILTTHHHGDHAGGNSKVLQQHNVPCYGGSKQVQGVTNIVDSGSEPIHLGSLEIKPLSTGGHTLDHICYYVADDAHEQKAVFTGDCIFSSGCGRFFEGTPSDMWKAISTIKALPEATRVYFGHEYTRSNLKFAVKVDPENKALQDKIAWAEKEACTTPSTIKNEKETNPFFRADEPSMRERVMPHNPKASAVEVLATIRQMKDGTYKQ